MQHDAHDLPGYDTSKLIGKSIALYNPTHKRFVRMPTGTNMDKSGEKADGTLPNGWIWEKFKIVELGNGLIALYNPTHKRFVRMPDGTNMDKSGERPDGTLPQDWAWEMFKVVDVGKVILHEICEKEQDLAAKVHS